MKKKGIRKEKDDRMIKSYEPIKSTSPVPVIDEDENKKQNEFAILDRLFFEFNNLFIIN